MLDRATAAFGFSSIFGSNVGRLALVGESLLGSSCDLFGGPEVVSRYVLYVHMHKSGVG